MSNVNENLVSVFSSIKEPLNHRTNFGRRSIDSVLCFWRDIGIDPIIGYRLKLYEVYTSIESYFLFLIVYGRKLKPHVYAPAF